MEIVDRIKVVTVNGIMQVSGSKYEARVFRQLCRYRQSIDLTHLYVKKHNVGLVTVDIFHSFHRVGKGCQFNSAEPMTKLSYHIKCQRLVVNSHTSYYICHPNSNLF